MSALLLSPIFRALEGAIVLAGAFLTWLSVHDAKIEKAATAEVVGAVEKKADADAKLAETVRKDVAGGKRGIPDPHRLQPVPAARPDRAGI